MPQIIPVFKKDEIELKISEIAEQISHDYASADLVLVGVLKGAFIFMADLIRELTIPVKIDFVRVSSYGSGTETSGEIRLAQDLETDIEDKDVLIVEDIVDTGLTLSRLVEHFGAFGPRSVRICALVDKKERRKMKIDISYACCVVDEGFLVGYGLDYAENYRHLPDICHLKF